MNWTIETFDQLTSKEIYEILRSRAEVFVKEQKISYVDPDGVDYKSWHIFAMDNDRICAYLRAFKDGEDTIKIGRVLTLIHGKGTGTQLMKYAISELKAKISCKKIIMDAQSGFFVYPSQKENGTNEQDEPAKIKNWTLKPFAGKTEMLTNIPTSTSA